MNTIKFFKATPATYFSKEENKQKPILPKKGDTLRHISNDELISILKSLNESSNSQKGANGMIFFYEYPCNHFTAVDEMRKSDKFTSNGLGFLDFDHLNDIKPNLTVDILNHWELYAQQMFNLYIGVTSHSQNGLHLITVTDKLSEDDYKLEIVRQYSYMAKLIKDIEGVDITEYKNVCDPVGCQLTQRMFLDKSPLVCVNKYATVMNWGAGYDMKKFAAKVKIPESLKKVIAKVEYNKRDDAFKSDISNYDFNLNSVENVEKVEYIPHQERMTLYSSLMWLFDGEELHNQWVRCCNMIPTTNHSLKFYINEPYKNHWERRGCSVTLLKTFGYDVEKRFIKTQSHEIHQDLRPIWHPEEKENVYEIKDGEYLYDYIDIIEKEIINNDRLVIKGNTGIGKTYAISRLAKKLNGIVLVPFLSLRGNYEDNLTIVDTTGGYSRAVPSCMVYDRFAMIDNRKFEKKIIFVDESHILFLDRTYRDRLVVLYKKLNDLIEYFGCKVVFVSATPLQEAENIKTLEFSKSRPYVNVSVYNVKNTYNAINKMIDSDEWRGKYNRMLVFTDKNARQIKDNRMYMTTEQLSIIHTEYGWTGDLERISKSNVLDSDVTVATSLAFNGLNFNNENEKVLILSELDHESTAWELIQQCGRMRKSIVDIRIINPATESNAKTVEQKRNKAEAYRTLDDVIYKTDNEVLNEDVFNAWSEIEKYVDDNKGLDKIFENLKNEGYFIIDENIIEEDNSGRVSNQMRQAADKLSRNEDELDAETYEFESENLKKYYFEYVNAKNKLYRIADKEFVNRVMNQVMNRMVKSICDEIVVINSIISYSNDEWDNLENRVMNAIQYWNEKDPVTARDIAKERKKNQSLRKIYGDCKNGNEVIEKYIELYLEVQEKRIEKISKFKKTNGNGKGIKVKIKSTESNEVFEFDTWKDAINTLKLSGTVVKTLKSNGIHKKWFLI